jgi:hypothetical protein
MKEFLELKDKYNLQLAKISNLEDAKTKWGKYNWDPTYWKKLWDNIQYISEK